MTHDEQTEIIEDTFESIRKLRATKGKEYAHSDTDRWADAPYRAWKRRSTSVLRESR